MVQFTLPKGSSPKKGKEWPVPTQANGKRAKRTKQFKVYRYDPDKGWKRLADLPYPVVAAPSPAPPDRQGR